MASVPRIDNRGQALITGMIAAAIVATATIGTVSLGTYLVKQSARAQTLNRAVVLQNQVQSAFLRKDQFTPGAGAPGPGFKLTDGPAGHVVAVLGRRVNFTADGVADCDSNSPACSLYVDADLKCAATSGCQAAYRVGIRAVAGWPTPSPLGAPNRDAAGVPGSNGTAVGTFAPGDYTLRLSYDAIQNQAASVCAKFDLLMTGMNKLTGEVFCAAPSTDACPAGTIADSVVTKTPNLGRELVLRCHPLAKVQCPPDYVLRSFNFGQLDLGHAAATDGPANTLVGTCVYRWRNDVDFKWSSQETSSGNTTTNQVCNSDVYDPAPGACAAVVTNDRAGSCPPVTTCSGPVNAQTCSTTVATPHSTVTATPTVSPTAANKNFATCVITITNECGSSATAKSAWPGKCLVKERVANPSLLKPPVNGRYP